MAKLVFKPKEQKRSNKTLIISLVITLTLLVLLYGR